MLIFSAMGPMTGKALDEEVLVPRISCLLADWVRGVLLPVVAAATEIDDACLVEEEQVVRRMGIVTGNAFTIPYGFMLGQGFLLAADSVLVATAAGGDEIRFDEPFLLGGMGVVATEASLLVKDGPMDPVFGKHAVDKSAVATAAEFKATLLGLEGRRGV